MAESLSTSQSVAEAAHHAGWKRDLRNYRLVAAVVWTVVILTLCWAPKEVVHHVEKKSSWFEINNFDKAVHLGIFVGFSVLWARAWPWPARRRYVLVGLMVLGLAALTEIGQLLPAVGRDASVADGATDVLGGVIGLALMPLLEPLFRAIESRLFGSSIA